MLSAEERALEREAKKGMNEEEAVFSVESALEQTYEWSDKYRPRKPRYGAGGGGGILSDPDPAFYVDAVPDRKRNQILIQFNFKHFLFLL